MSELPPELVALLGRLNPKQQESFLAIVQSARDQASFERALAQQPELLVALREAVASNLSGIPTDLRAIIDELSQPARSLGEMPRRIKLCRQALAAVDKEKRATLWGWLHSLLGDSLAQNPMGSREDNLEQAIAHYGQALEVRTRQAYPKSWAATQNNLANAYSQRSRGERAENLEQAIAHYGQALSVKTLDLFPADFQQTHCNLGHLHFGKAEWSEALASYREAIRAEQHLLAAAYTEAGRWSETAQTSGLYAPAAYALLKLDQPGEALVQLEQGKTRLLSRALALDEVDLSVLPPADQEALRSARQTIRALEAEMRLPPDTAARRDDRVLAETLAETRARLNETIADIRVNHSGFMCPFGNAA